jgi:predicted porin
MPDIKIPTAAGVSLDADKSFYAGALIGVEAEYQLADMFSLAAGLNFAMQGCQWEDTELKIGGESLKWKDNKIQLNYLNLPVVANVYLFKGFAIKTGVQLGFLLSAKRKYDMTGSVSGTNATVKYDEDVKDQCNKLDVAIPIGVSYQIPTVPVYIDARYNLGLTKIVKDIDESVKNQVFQLTVGYKFAL